MRGLVIVGGGNIEFRTDDEHDMRHKFEYAKLAGMPLIVCAPTKITLPKLEKFVQEFDIKIAVHNHGPKDNFPAPQDALKILKDMDPRCGVCVDIGHTAEAGVDILAAIKASGPRLLDMHIKDMRVFGDVNTLCDVGDGVLPIRRDFPRAAPDALHSVCQSRIRDQRERPVSRHEPVVRLHARRARRIEGISSMRGALVSIAIFLTALQCGAADFRHPLDALTAEEYWAVFETMKASGKLDGASRYAGVNLHEPPKAEVLHGSRAIHSGARRWPSSSRAANV